MNWRVVLGGGGGDPSLLLQVLIRRLALVNVGSHLIIGDHTASMGVFDQLSLLAEAGFVDVDVAWRKRDWFVCGGRRPLLMKSTLPHV